jgi:endoglucanase
LLLEASTMLRLATIVQEIVDLGVNSVRLPWANETLENNPQVPDLCGESKPTA